MYETKLTLEQILQPNVNLCEILNDNDLGKIGTRVVKDFEADDDSMSDWKDRNEKAFKLLEHTFTGNSQPWDNAANAKIPLVMNAAIKFQSEAGAEILKGDEIVKYEIFGEKTKEKEERGARVKAHMNFQLFHEMENWDGDHDQLLMVLPLIGCLHKQVTFDPVDGVNKSELCLDNITIAQDTTSVKKARVTKEFERDKNEIYENEAAKNWKKIDYPNIDDEEDSDQEFFEQFRRLDLDGDGYEEPYIVTVHKESKTPVRIIPNFRAESVQKSGQKVSRIPPLSHFVKYGFIPAPDGTYWDYGWGLLLGPLNDNCNALINMLLDAGTLSNTPSGWISSSVRLISGDNKFKPGEFKRVKVSGGVMRDAVFPLPVREPSQVLFILLELLIDAAKEFTSVTDVMSGEQPQANMAAATVMALIERGRMTFNSIYKRIYRSMKLEFKMLFDLNAIYVDPDFYREFFDLDLDPRADYEKTGYDIIPTANPEFSSRIQRIAQAESLLPIADAPEVNKSIILRQYVLGVTEDDKLVDQIVPEQPNLTPAMVAQEIENAKQQMKADLEVQKLQLEVEEAAVSLRKAELDATLAGVTLPEKTALAEAKTVEQMFKTQKARIEAEVAGMSDADLERELGFTRAA